MRYAKCPLCGCSIEIDLNSQNGTQIDLWLKNPEDNTNTLLTALHNYWQWCAEGKKEYYGNTHKDVPTQHYYDGYHNHIKYLPDEDSYEFNIQTFDSTEGDQWWKGKFKYREWDDKTKKDRKFFTIKIVESHSYSQ